jgi:hypothetical protein
VLAHFERSIFKLLAGAVPLQRNSQINAEGLGIFSAQLAKIPDTRFIVN